MVGAVDWRRHEDNVRRLRQRIFAATRAFNPCCPCSLLELLAVKAARAVLRGPKRRKAVGLPDRGVALSYETMRRWCAKFGQAYANQLRRRRPRPGDKWHLDEVFVGINGRLRYVWRAVDQHGNVLDVLVQSRRNAVAAKRFFRKLLKGLRYVPRVLVTDKLGSYQVAHRELLSSVEHRRSRYLNNRAENSHQPTRQRERAMKRFKSSRHAQRFLSAFSGISAHFRPRRHLLSATEVGSRAGAVTRIDGRSRSRW